MKLMHVRPLPHPSGLAALAPSRADLAAALDHLPDAVILFDVAWRCRYLNRAAERMLARAAVQLVGRIIWDELDDLVDPAVERCLTRSALEGREVIVSVEAPACGRRFVVHAVPTSGGVTCCIREAIPLS
jgi:PAS domain S-box-containing protein